MRKFHTFELALLLALATTLLWGAWSLHRQDDLQAKMIRLHVIANSDNAADQALKLQVRDAVLTRAEAILQESADMNDARRRLMDALPAIGDAAAAELAAQHRDDPVSVSLEEAEFPLKAYDGFALPSGGYLALRVVIGAGEGRNWWCVVFPQLCLPATAAEFDAQAAGAGFSDTLTGAVEGEYPIRFFLLDCLGKLENWLGSRG